MGALPEAAKLDPEWLTQPGGRQNTRVTFLGQQVFPLDPLPITPSGGASDFMKSLQASSVRRPVTSKQDCSLSPRYSDSTAVWRQQHSTGVFALETYRTCKQRTTIPVESGGLVLIPGRY